MFKKRYSLPTLLVCLLLAVLFTFQVTFVTTKQYYKEQINQIHLQTNKDAEKMALVADLLHAYCIYDVTDPLKTDAALSAYLAYCGDRWAYYYSADAFAAQNQSDAGNHSGIGITLSDHEKGLLVTTVALGSPAEAGGLIAGDVLISVNENSLTSLTFNEKADLLLGKTGDVFEIEFLRGEETLAVSLVRSAYESPSVIGRLLSDQVGLVRIETFDNNTAALFKQVTADLVKQGANAFLYDLRDCPGGQLTAIVEVLDYLLPEGLLVTLEHYDGTKEEFHAKEGSFDYPAVILTNGTTASAAELFAACMRDYEAAILLGENTYGKGVAQSTFPLPDGSAVRITTAKYYSPKTPWYDGVGLSPDIEVKTPENLTDFAHSSLESDPQMQKAVEVLCKE